MLSDYGPKLGKDPTLHDSRAALRMWLPLIKCSVDRPCACCVNRRSLCIVNLGLHAGRLRSFHPTFGQDKNRSGSGVLGAPGGVMPRVERWVYLRAGRQPAPVDRRLRAFQLFPTHRKRLGLGHRFGGQRAGAKSSRHGGFPCATLSLYFGKRQLGYVPGRRPQYTPRIFRRQVTCSVYYKFWAAENHLREVADPRQGSADLSGIFHDDGYGPNMWVSRVVAQRACCAKSDARGPPSQAQQFARDKWSRH
ncbi:hypothetical protein LY76DRAFT_430899 [Colletotrichum caudatum]|nr:hypothetical protein LY76DRAFT_430899 [Colletotrichum caudatum]